MGIFYLLHEYTERYHPNYPLGKKFARTIILGFIFYYVAYFLIPLYFVGLGPRIQHFVKFLVVVDIMSSSIFYGGMLNSLSFWSTGQQITERFGKSETTPRQTTQRPKSVQTEELTENLPVFVEENDQVDSESYSDDSAESD